MHFDALFSSSTIAQGSKNNYTYQKCRLFRRDVSGSSFSRNQEYLQLLILHL